MTRREQVLFLLLGCALLYSKLDKSPAPERDERQKITSVNWFGSPIDPRHFHQYAGRLIIEFPTGAGPSAVGEGKKASEAKKASSGFAPRLIRQRR